MKDSGQIDELLNRGVAEVIDRRHLETRLRRGDKLRVKLGIDPTGAKLHLGHAVVLRLLRRFQDLGHTAVLIIGDTTAMIGDPSGRNETRPPLTEKDIAKNVATYERQALKILDRKRIEFRWQSEWFKKFKLNDVIREASKLSAGWITSHETFRQRLKNGQPLAFHELFYPMIQAYDSVAVKADVELGGLDQKFNILTGRELMRTHDLEPQDIVLAKYLVGTDGQKMGKSLGNFIAIEEDPFAMFGKIMAMPDAVLRDYFELATEVPLADLQKMQMSGTEARNTKMFLARKIVEAYHGVAKSNVAMKKWDNFLSGVVVGTPRKLGDLPNGTLIEFFGVFRLTSSKSEAQRLIQQGGVKVNGQVVKDIFFHLSAGDKVVFGKQKKTFVLK
ncbi:MAG: tyrosine--tRNA ligase [Candidatus Kerfeldbacteria bacterium]|nr:tyrosine--tRNA ligase [Candidatus Kerfeldbacteria bacterium]